jgi:hypothetical protein
MLLSYQASQGFALSVASQYFREPEVSDLTEVHVDVVMGTRLPMAVRPPVCRSGFWKNGIPWTTEPTSAPTGPKFVPEISMSWPPFVAA